MEVQLLVSGCVACGAGAFVLTAPGSGVSDRVRARGGRGVGVARVLERVARTAPVRALASWRPWAVVAGELFGWVGVPGATDGGAPCAALLAVGLAASLALGILASSLAGVIVCLASVPVLVVLRASSIERSREVALMGEMPDVLRSLATALGAGATLSQAIEYVATHEDGPIGREFGNAALELRCGGSVREALEDLEERLDAPGVELMTCALLISQRTGSPLRSLFSRSAGLVEEQVALKALLDTKTAQVRLSARIVCVMPVVMVLLLSLMSPEFRAGVASTVGIACLCVAATLDLVAVAIIRRLMRGVLG